MAATRLIRFRVEFGTRCCVGPGKIALLEAIHRMGSLSQAARDLGMSYRRAWLLTSSLNTSFREAVVLLTRGGRATAPLKKTSRCAPKERSERSRVKRGKDRGPPAQCRSFGSVTAEPEPCKGLVRHLIVTL